MKKNTNADRLLAIYTIVIVALSAGQLWNKIFPVILLPLGLLFHTYFKNYLNNKRQ